jgi:hypothetical protein
LLVAVLVLTGAAVVADGEQFGGFAAVSSAFAVMMLMLVLSVIAWTDYHPAVLIAQPGARRFTTADSPAQVLSSAAYSMLFTFLATGRIDDIADREALWQLDVVLVLLLAAALALMLRFVWGTTGVALRPDGVFERHPFGSRLIPWDAFDPRFPAVATRSTQVALYLQRPGLIRRRGLHLWLHTLTSATDGNHLAAAIHHYVNRPEHRDAIGTPEELHRLTTAITPVAAHVG